jgi:hypothetical protein
MNQFFTPALSFEKKGLIALCRLNKFRTSGSIYQFIKEMAPLVPSRW